MKTFSFLIIVIIAGLLAGLVHGMLNIVTVEPYLDNAIGIENQRLFAQGQEKDTPQFWQKFSDYRTWQKQGSIVSGAILGIATGSLFGVVYAYSRRSLPTRNEMAKALVLGAIMWAVIFFIPFLKYPASPPTVGDPNTITFRATTYVVFMLASGLGALGFALAYKKMRRRRLLALVGYAAFISAVFFVMPPNPDKVSIPMDLVNGFRTMSAVTMTVYWITNAAILGWLWKKVRPDASPQET